MSSYVFDQTWKREHARLRALEDLFDSASIRHLAERGVGAGWRCLEVGCGAGGVGGGWPSGSAPAAASWPPTWTFASSRITAAAISRSSATTSSPTRWRRARSTWCTSERSWCMSLGGSRP
jgi:hypothetical protein